MSVKLMQVYLVFKNNWWLNLNLQQIDHLRERVISKCGAFCQCMGGRPMACLTGTGLPTHQWLWSTKRWKMLRLVCHSEPGGAATSTGCLEILGGVFVCHKWLKWVSYAIWWAKDTSLSQLKSSPTIMTCFAWNINGSTEKHWIVTNIKMKNIGKNDFWLLEFPPYILFYIF